MRLRTILFAIAAVSLVHSCEKKEDPAPQPEVKPEIKVPAESQAIFNNGISFDSGSDSSSSSSGQSQSTTVKFTATSAWSADVADTKASAWLSVQPSSGGAGAVTMTVTAQPNTEDKARSVTVTIQCGTVKQSFTVNQDAAAPQTVAVESVTLNKSELTLEPGASETLTATVAPENATDKTVTWSTSNAEIATVDDGKVTAVTEGEAIIIATVSGKSAVCKVTVTKDVIAVESVTLNKTELMLEPGASETLTATVAPENATDKTVTWSTSNAEVATVADGKVTAVKEGVAIITAKAGEKEATCKVIVSADDVPFSLSPNNIEVTAEGGTFDVTVTCSTNYHVNSKPDWVTEISVNGKVHTFEVSANTATEERSGVIVFCDDKGTCLPCNVKQKAGSSGDTPFSLSPTSVDIGAYGGTFNVTVTCSSSYHLNSKPDWVTEQSVSDNVHTFFVSANSSTEPRSGVVVFCDDKGTCLPCNVKQRGADSGGGESGFDWTKEFIHQSLFMRFTATWCGYCPMMAEAVKIAQGKHPGKIQALNLHTTNSDLFFQPGLTLESTYSINGYPSGVIDGRKGIGNFDIETTANNIEKAFEQFEAAMRPVTTMGWQSSFSGQSLSIDLAMYIKTPGSYKVTVVLTESGIIKKQVDYNNGDQPNYQHNDIARVAVTDISGDIFTVSESNHIEKKSYSTTIPSSYNKQNMKILVYIQRAYGGGVSKIESSDFSGWYIDNCNSGKAGGNMSPAVAQEGSGGENEDVVGGNPINW